MKNCELISKFKPKDLISFGLNPLHWLSTEENDSSVKIVHIDDPELKLKVLFNPTNSKKLISSLEWILD